MGFLTYLGANAGSPTKIEIETPASVMAQGGKALAAFNAGKEVAPRPAASRATRSARERQRRPRPPLTKIGARLPRQAIARTLINPTAPMPSFRDLPQDKFDNLVEFLAQLK